MARAPVGRTRSERLPPPATPRATETHRPSAVAQSAESDDAHFRRAQTLEWTDERRRRAEDALEDERVGRGGESVERRQRPPGGPGHGSSCVARATVLYWPDSSARVQRATMRRALQEADDG